jgi:hypothetical protein
VKRRTSAPAALLRLSVEPLRKTCGFCFFRFPSLRNGRHRGRSGGIPRQAQRAQPLSLSAHFRSRNLVIGGGLFGILLALQFCKLSGRLIFFGLFHECTVPFDESCGYAMLCRPNLARTGAARVSLRSTLPASPHRTRVFPSSAINSDRSRKHPTSGGERRIFHPPAPARHRARSALGSLSEKRPG